MTRLDYLNFRKIEATQDCILHVLLYIACTTHTIALLTCLHYLTCDSKLTIYILRYVINGLVLVLIYELEFEAEYTTYLSALAALFAHYL